MRGDSKELIDLSIFYLEGKPDDTFRFKSGCFAGPRSIKPGGWGN